MSWWRHPKETHVKPLPPKPPSDKRTLRDVERATDHLEAIIRKLQDSLGTNGV